MKTFIVDFGSWIIEAEDKENAMLIAEKMLDEGERPPVDKILEENE